MRDDLTSIPVTFISLGGERPVHMAVDAAENVPLKPSAKPAPGEDRPLQVIELDDLNAAIEAGSVPGS